MDKKLRVGVLFGGKSAEHEISIRSAANIIEAIDRNKYDIMLIGIDREGEWSACDSAEFLPNKKIDSYFEYHRDNILALAPGQSNGSLIEIRKGNSIPRLDVVFPVLHGPMGEDGTVQGLLKLLDVPYVGSGVLGSAVGMDKDVMKRLLRDSRIPVAAWETVYSHERDKIEYGKIANNLGSPLFIKPANMGSSVGVHKVTRKDEFFEALEDAFYFDSKVLVEEFIPGREIECAVLGNENPAASVPGEICTNHAFYSYKAKYIDENGAALNIPADLPESITEKIRGISLKSFKVLCCEGMARVDCFLREDGKIYVNELNTIPGFTSISMYPMLWEATGIPYSELIDRLITLAIERHEKERKLKSSYE